MVIEMPNSSTSQETRLGNGNEDGDSLLNKVMEGKHETNYLDFQVKDTFED